LRHEWGTGKKEGMLEGKTQKGRLQGRKALPQPGSERPPTPAKRSAIGGEYTTGSWGPGGRFLGTKKMCWESSKWSTSKKKRKTSHSDGEGSLGTFILNQFQRPSFLMCGASRVEELHKKEVFWCLRLGGPGTRGIANKVNHRRKSGERGGFS